MTYDLSGIRVGGKVLPTETDMSLASISSMSRGALQNYGFFHPDEIEGYEDEGKYFPCQAFISSFFGPCRLTTFFNIYSMEYSCIAKKVHAGC